MALVKVKPRITRPSLLGQGRQSRDLHKGKPHAPLLESQSKRAWCNNSGHITMRHQGGGHKQQYRIVDFKRAKYGVSAKVERLEYDPNPQRQPGSAVLFGRRAPLHHRAQGRRRGHAAHVGFGSPDQQGQYVASAQYSSGYRRALCRDAARQGRADRARGRHLGALARAGSYAQIRLRSG